jgi:hypothetical protein
MGRPNKDMVYLGRMREEVAQHRALPSYAELSRVLGFRAKNASFKLCARLAADGYVESGQSGRLLPGRRFFELPQADERIPAGSGEPGEFAGGIEPQVLDRLLIDVPSKMATPRSSSERRMHATATSLWPASTVSTRSRNFSSREIARRWFRTIGATQRSSPKRT